MPKGSNLLRLGDFNQTVVLDAIRRSHGGTSRVELVAETGLTAQTVSNIVRRLLDQQLVREGERIQAAGARGKPRTRLQIEPSARCAVGVHVDPAVLTFVLTDLAGQVRRYARRRTPQAQRPDDVVAVIAEQVERLIADADVDPASVLGVGVAAPGPLDVVDGVLLDPPQLRGWEKVRLRADLRAATGRHVLVDKDVTAAATGELWARGGARHSFVFCYLGSGLGAGVVMEDQVLRGISNNIGEIGNILVDPGADDLGFARPGSLAASCLPQALVVQAQRRGLVGPVDPDDFVAVDEAFTVLCERAYAGEGDCLRLLDDAATTLAAGLAVLINFLDVGQVVLGGPIWSRISSRMLELLPGLIQPQLVAASSVSVEGSAVGEHVAAQGAAALVLDHYLSPRPSVLLMD